MKAVNDVQLAETCRNGSRADQDQAWSELVAKYGKRIYNVAYHFTFRMEEAEELSQEIFLKLWQNLDRYDGSTSLLGWMIGVSRNHCIDHYRKFKRERGFRHVGDDVIALLAGPDNPSQELDRKERLSLLLEGIETLPDDLAEVVILRDLDDLSYAEMVDVLGLPEGTVKSRLNRARIELGTAVRRLAGLPPGTTPLRGRTRSSEVN